MHALIDSFNLKEKQLVITVGESVLNNALPDDLDSISSCTHEEAETHMLLHACHGAHHGHENCL